MSNAIWLALDLGLSTGWATRICDKFGTAQIMHGHETFHHASRFEGHGMRYLKFNRWLGQMLMNLGHIDWVCFEEVRGHKGVDAAHAYGGFLSHLLAWCELNGIPYLGVPVGTIKKFATGKGNSGKNEMIAAMRKKGHMLTDTEDDDADALAIIHWMVDYTSQGNKVELKRNPKRTRVRLLEAMPRRHVAVKG